MAWQDTLVRDTAAAVRWISRGRGARPGSGAPLSLRVHRSAQFPQAPRPVPLRPRGPDVSLQLRARWRSSDGNLVIAIADPSQLMMIDEVGLLLGKRLVTKVATLSQITESQEDRAVAARAGGSQRRLRPRRHQGGRGRRRDHLHRAADPGGRNQPHHPPGGHHHLHRAAAAGQRHPHRDRATTTRSSSTASTACCSRPCRPSAASTIPPSSAASR